MEYRTHDLKSYKIHTLKTDRFKTSRIEVFFRSEVIKDKLPIQNFLACMLNDTSKKYNTRKKVAIQIENLYKSFYYASFNKLGNVANTIFSIDFINPEFIKEKDYLNDVISFLFEMILKPNVKNEEFDLTSFNNVKNDILLDIESIEENAHKKAINNALNVMDKNSLSSLSTLGSKKDISKITPEKLYKEYLNLINNSVVDIFITGNINMDEVIRLIKSNYHNNHIVTKEFDYYIQNKNARNINSKMDEGNFLQTQLITLYNLNDLTKNEKEVTLNLLNYILGSGGLSSKLYRYLREENGFCYRTSSMYFKYDNLLCISVSLKKENINMALKYIEKAINEMKKGIFTDEDVTNAKNNLLFALEMNKSNQNSILANYEFKIFLGNYTIDERIDLIDKITKQDLINLAKKIKLNTKYALCEASNE